jgi:hypothetical protein
MASPVHRIIAAAALVIASMGAARAGERPVVVELFTSQSCYSCPPAEAFLGELAGRPSMIALELHVDYWDDLVYGAAGRWKDAFSDPAFTARQRTYNRAIRGTGSVYTPQMVIDGRREAVGSDRARVLDAIRAAQTERPSGVVMEVRARAGGGLTVQVGGAGDAPADVFLVRFDRRHTTAVRAGENKGKTLENHHVVRAVQAVGRWTGAPLEINLAALRLAAGEGCAVLVQSPRDQRILGAAACPMPPS